MYPDLAFISMDFEGFSNQKKGGYIVLSFRNQLVGDKKDDSYESGVVKIIDVIINTAKYLNKQIVFCYQDNRDFQFMKKMHQKFRQRNTIFLKEKAINEENMGDFYSKAEIIFTNRMHVFLCGLLTGTVAIGVSDFSRHHKLKDCIKDLSLEELMIDIHRTKDVMSMISTISANENILLQKIVRKCDKKRLEAQHILEDILSTKITQEDKT